MRQTTFDYHFLLIASNLGAEWFFDAARAYWDRFHPTVISDLEFVRLVPQDASVAVTVIARRDTVAQYGVELAQIHPDALFDPVAHDTFDDMEAALDQRAASNQPFGIPQAEAAPAGNLISPTPGAILGGPPPPTRAPAGFVTQTPTPTPPAATTIQPSPSGAPTSDEPAETREPILPTPGPVIGG